VISGVKIVFEGETVEADQMDFVTESTISGRYKVEDGAAIELSHHVKTVYRLKARKKPDGSPLYVLIGEVKADTKLPTVVPAEAPLVEG
jgi:hypothetical protein